MTISNIIARAKKRVPISENEAHMLLDFFRYEKFEGYIITSRKKLSEITKSKHPYHMYVSNQLSYICCALHSREEKNILILAPKNS